jgi:hypothetical protein
MKNQSPAPLIGPVKDKRARPTVLIVFGLFLFWGFGWETVGQRLQTEIDGVVIARQDVPSTGAPRYSTEYTIRGADGREQVYWAGPTDASLPRSMPVGTRIQKKRWQLEFTRDGQTQGFPYVFYGLVMAAALCLVVWGLVSLRPRRQ